MASSRSWARLADRETAPRGDTMNARSRILSNAMRDGGFRARGAFDRRPARRVVQQGKFTFLVAKRKEAFHDFDPRHKSGRSWTAPTAAAGPT